MKYLISSLFFIALFFSCKNENKKTQNIDNQAVVFNISSHFNQFKYHNLTDFRIDTFEFGTRKNQYQFVDSLSFEKVFVAQAGFSAFQWLYYYATFQDPNLIAVLEESDEYGTAIWLVKFDEKGRFQHKEIIALRGGDKGLSWEKFSKLDNKSIFTIKSVNRNQNVSTNKTTITTLQLDANSFKMDTLYVKKQK